MKTQTKLPVPVADIKATQALIDTVDSFRESLYPYGTDSTLAVEMQNAQRLLSGMIGEGDYLRGCRVGRLAMAIGNARDALLDIKSCLGLSVRNAEAFNDRAS